MAPRKINPLVWVLICLIIYFVYVLLRDENTIYNSQKFTSISTIIVCLSVLVLTFFTKKKREMPSNSQKSTYSVKWRAFGTLGVGIISYFIFAGGTHFFRENLDVYGGWILLATFGVPLIYILTLSFINRHDPHSIFYIIRNFSKTARVAIGVGAILIFILYTYAQCQAFSLPWSLECVAHTIGR